MKLKIATFNLENLFTRPSAMRDGSGEIGQEAIEDHARLNAIIAMEVYSTPDKATLVELAQKYGFHRLNQPVDALIFLQKIRAGLFSTKNGELVVAAKGRSDWTGWFELRRDDVIWEATFNTARVIAEVNADVLVCVEAENRIALQRFNDVVLKPQFDMNYPHVMLIDGNDKRGIDVGIMSRFPITSITSHIDDIDTRGERVFSRDCPQYTIELSDGTSIAILPNHFKSKRGGDNAASRARRTSQSTRASQIALAALAATDYVMIAGDLNDTPEGPELAPVFSGGFVDVMDHPDYPTDRPGTYGTGLAANKLDYLIMSPSLRQCLSTTGIERRGSYHPQTWQPFDTVRSKKQEASDHHCVWAEFEL